MPVDDPTTKQIELLLKAGAKRAATTVAILAQLRSFRGRSVLGVTGIGAAWTVIAPLAKAKLGL